MKKLQKMDPKCYIKPIRQGKDWVSHEGHGKLT